MRAKTIHLLLLCLCLLLPDGGRAGDLDAQVDQCFRDAKTVGGSVVILLGGDLVYARDYGYKNLRAKVPVDEGTFFKTASITKMVTGIGLMRLVEEGKLDLDADISSYYGYRIANPYYPKASLTLRQLMSHTSSLSEEGGFSNLNSRVSQMLKLSLNRRSNFLRALPGSKYQYSNFGAGLAGAIMEAATGESVNRYMTSAVFAPLGIQAAYSASLLPTPLDVTHQYLNGSLHRAAQGQISQVYEDFADPEKHFRTTAGDLWMRSRDMAKLAAVLCGDGSYGGVRLLNEVSLLLMRQEQSDLGASVTGQSPYGLFLEHNDTLIPGKTVYGHQGMSTGAILNVYFEPLSGFVFVLFSNGGSLQRDNRVGRLARNLITLLYPVFRE
ncbi:MAG: serine hydrolase domain-containing protein [Christensenellales bacterium]